MKIIAKCLGGSHSYGLNTPTSDIDYRGIGLNDSISSIIGLEKHEHQKGEGIDEYYFEFRRALQLLRRGNTQILELLFTDNWIELSDEWKMVIENRSKLIDSDNLFSCLRGYMQGEIRLTLGSRTGRLGSKRSDQLEKFGYSPKNAVQAQRLSWAGGIYFKKGYFPVRIDKEDKSFSDFLLDLKVNPGGYSKETIEKLLNKAEQDLVTDYENREVNTVFDADLANDLAYLVYAPMLRMLWDKRSSEMKYTI